MNKTYSSFLLSALAIACCVGCGGGGPTDQPDLADVSGTVTLDGKPLANAMVEFSPDGEGRPSTGTTSSNGSYTLQYTANHSGAKIGVHSVTVSIAGADEDYEEGEGGTDDDGADDDGADDDGDDEDEDVEADTGLPPGASDGSIKETVKAGSNTIDIAL
ncbi:MAG: carboxypeptidase-like regulatory domain-containing protein [Fuerstiella sp.]